MKNISNQSEIIYPRFIADKPEGKDDYISKSQKRVSENIIMFLHEHENALKQKRVIGLEGEWGSGKSNIIELLKNELKNDYFFYIFDSWGHQEDLTRRSILEGLLDKLLKNNILVENKEEWGNKLKTLLAKKVEKEHKKIPKLSFAFVLSLIAVLFMPISKFVAEMIIKNHSIAATQNAPYIPPSNFIYFISLLILVAPLLPIFIYLLLNFIKAKKGNRLKAISELFFIFKGEEIVNTSEETISEREPTVRQFTNFLYEIERSCPSKKIIIVFDNMDRLPTKKVIEIWSSIHTFFGNDESDLSTWALVTYDDEHICNTFKDTSDKKNYNADSYIHKTFSIVFHVPPPILSDWKDFFGLKFKEAFGIQPPEGQNIETIYEYFQIHNSKIKPRDIICFINDLVALKKQWKEEIPFKFLSLFLLARHKIMENPFNVILSKDYLGNCSKMFENEDQLTTYISAIAFNVELSIADEILLKPVITSCLNGKSDLLSACRHNSFFIHFDSIFHNTNFEILHTIKSLNEIPNDLQQNPRMVSYWIKLANEILNKNYFNKDYEEQIKTLVFRLEDNSLKEKLISFLFMKSIVATNDEPKCYYGEDYFDLIIEYEKIIEKTSIPINLCELLPTNLMSPDEYFDFIDASKNDYVKYKVVCLPNDLNEFLIKRFDSNEISKYFINLSILSNNTDFSQLISHVNTLILTLTPTLPQIEILLDNIIKLSKAISIKDYLPIRIPDSIASTLLNTFKDTDLSTDLLLSIIFSHSDSTQKINIETPAYHSLFDDTSRSEYFIEQHPYYLNFDKLIKFNLNYSSALCKLCIQEVVKRKKEIRCSSITSLLNLYKKIKANIFDNNIEQCNELILRINSIFKEANDEIIVEIGVDDVYEILIDNSEIDCNLIKDIINYSGNYFTKLSIEQWQSTLKASDSSLDLKLYVHLVTNDYGLSLALPPNGQHAYSQILKQIAKRESPIPTNKSNWNILFDMHDGNMDSAYKDVRDELLSFNHGDVTIEELSFFEKGLFRYGHLDESSSIVEETFRRVLNPTAVNNHIYINIIRDNKQSILNLVKQAGDIIFDFKLTLDSKCVDIYTQDDLKELTDEINRKYEQMSIKIAPSSIETTDNEEIQM